MANREKPAVSCQSRTGVPAKVDGHAPHPDTRRRNQFSFLLLLCVFVDFIVIVLFFNYYYFCSVAKKKIVGP